MKPVVTADDTVLLVVVFQSISEQFDFEPASAAAVAELGLASGALHVIAAGDSLDVNLRQDIQITRPVATTAVTYD